MFHLTILHFNDVHGRLDALPRLFTLIQRERASALRQGRAVLVLDGGDSSEGGQWESAATQGRANFALLEAMGVNATVLGNNEPQWGRAALERLVASVHFPVLAANLSNSADPSQLAVPGLQASTLIDLVSFKVGLVGVTTVVPNAYDRFGFQAIDPIPIVRREAAALKAQGAHFIILLSHLGYAPSETKKTWTNPNDITDDVVAAACPEIGVVVGGHSHQLVERPMLIGNTLIVQAGDLGRYLGRLDVDIDPATGRGRTHAYQLFSTEGVPPDPTINATLELVREEVARLPNAHNRALALS